MTTSTLAPSAAASAACEVASHRRSIDLARAADAAAELLDALGLDATSPGLERTPTRIAEMFAELLTAAPFSATTFPNDGGYDELVVVTDIPFTSLCEHHLLPFRGVAHVGYLPGERIVGLSKLARLVDAFARRPQTQERMTTQVAGWLNDRLAPKGAGVVIEAEHLCMSIRGIRSAGARTVTSRLCGRLRDDQAARAEFLHLTRNSNAKAAP
ncbi:MAG: GTP cyclohydrolase I FolE [Egibacteraceae bacterium]